MPKFSVRKRTQEMLSNLSFLDLQRMARNQEITPRDEIREDGKTFWQLASTIDGLNFEPIPKFSVRKPDGKVIADLTANKLMQMGKSGDIAATDRIRKDGRRTWHLATTVKGLEFMPEEVESGSGLLDLAREHIETNESTPPLTEDLARTDAELRGESALGRELMDYAFEKEELSADFTIPDSSESNEVLAASVHGLIVVWIILIGVIFAIGVLITS